MFFSVLWLAVRATALVLAFLQCDAAPAEATAGSGAYAPPSEQTGGGFQVASSVPDFSTDAPEMAAPAPPPPAEPAPAADHADE